MRKITATSSTGASSGSVTRKNTAGAGTPSIRAASYSSRGIICSPASSSRAMKGVVFQTSVKTIAARASPGSASQAIPSPMSPRPTRTAFTTP